MFFIGGGKRKETHKVLSVSAEQSLSLNIPQHWFLRELAFSEDLEVLVRSSDRQ